MTTLGTVVLAKEIGKLGGHGSEKYIWQPCTKCGVARWVKINSKNKESYTGLCRKCLGIGVIGLSLSERFWSFVKKNDSGCWEWVGCKTKKGYGHFQVGKTSVNAHRMAYELTYGNIPEGKTIDHLCRNRGCVNPAHLEPVTNHQNILRSKAPSAINALKTHCPKGHPYDLVNTYYDSKGHRRCRICLQMKRKRANQ